MIWKKHRGKLLAALVLAALLAACCTGGGGGSLPERETPSAQAAAASAPATASAVSAQAPEGSPAPSGLPEESRTPEVAPAESGGDRPLTVPAPEGEAQPAGPTEAADGPKAYSCTLSVSCAVLLDKLDSLDEDKRELVPADGWLLAPVTVVFYEGESVFNVLQRTMKQEGIHMEFVNTPVYSSAYIEGIGNLYEFDAGELSGWMYRVNGSFPNYGCSRYVLQDGDGIEWVYTCDLGRDVGGAMEEGGQKDA